MCTYLEKVCSATVLCFSLGACRGYSSTHGSRRFGLQDIINILKLAKKLCSSNEAFDKVIACSQLLAFENLQNLCITSVEPIKDFEADFYSLISLFNFFLFLILAVLNGEVVLCLRLVIYANLLLLLLVWHGSVFVYTQ